MTMEKQPFAECISYTKCVFFFHGKKNSRSTAINIRSPEINGGSTGCPQFVHGSVGMWAYMWHIWEYDLKRRVQKGPKKTGALQGKKLSLWQSFTPSLPNTCWGLVFWVGWLGPVIPPKPVWCLEAKDYYKFLSYPLLLGHPPLRSLWFTVQEGQGYSLTHLQHPTTRVFRRSFGSWNRRLQATMRSDCRRQTVREQRQFTALS